MFEGVEGREMLGWEVEVDEFKGWYACPDKGEVGRRRFNVGDSGSESGVPLVFRVRSSGVNLPFVLR